jgi:hypothetical protein
MENLPSLLLIGVVIYFLPAIVASSRRHRNRLAIGILNLLLGCTLLGWIVAMVWACTSDVEPRPQVTYDYGNRIASSIASSRWFPDSQRVFGIMVLVAAIALGVVSWVVSSRYEATVAPAHQSETVGERALLCGIAGSC